MANDVIWQVEGFCLAPQLPPGIPAFARDIDGNVIKLNDHLMDAKRYLVMSGLGLMQTKPLYICKSVSLGGSTGIRAWMM
jgi:hypothetical protein